MYIQLLAKYNSLFFLLFLVFLDGLSTLVLLCWLDWMGSHSLGASRAARFLSTSRAAVGSAGEAAGVSRVAAGASREAAGASREAAEDGDVASGGRRWHSPLCVCCGTAELSPSRG